MSEPEDEIGTAANPCSAENSTWEDRAYKFCRCDDCGLVARCTQQLDFYDSDLDGRLRCEPCFSAHIRLPIRKPGEPPKAAN